MIDGPDLSYLSKAREQLNTRRYELLDKANSNAGGGTRFTIDNAGQGTGWENKWFAQDTERSKQLDWLEKALTGGDLTKTTNDLATTGEAAANRQSENTYATSKGAVSSGVAKSGLAGGSQHMQENARLSVALQTAKTQAKAQADDLRRAGIEGVEDMERQLVDQIMVDNGFYTAAQSAAVQGQQVDITGARMQSDLDNQYRGILASALTDVTQSTVQPFVTEGFNSADRYNQQQNLKYNQAVDDWRYNGRETGQEPAIPTQRTWGY